MRVRAPRLIQTNYVDYQLSFYPAARIRYLSIVVLCLATLLVSLLLGGCNYFFKREPGIGKAVKWSELKQWVNDDQLQAWAAMRSQCPRMIARDEQWKSLCAHVESTQNPTTQSIRAFFETHFEAHRIYGKYGDLDGLITGYYEPILDGSLVKTEKYAYPLYSSPEDMLTIDLADVYPSLNGMRLRGRLEGNRVVPYLPRSQIDGENQPLAGQEILWIDDPYGSFFLQIQGSGRVVLEDGQVLGVNYANQNGHPYVAIGKKLVEMNVLALEEVSLFSIKRWLQDNPDSANEVLNANPSYVFFDLRKNNEESARGSLNVPLTAGRSLAVDRRVIPLGTPVWLETTLPDGSQYHRLMFAQDTGGAIRGPVRADVFFGTGDNAEQLAGEMKQSGRMYALMPLAE